MFLLLLSLAFADAAPEPCDGLSEGAACTDYNDAAGTCTSCGTNCLECTANSTDSSSEEKKETEDHGCSVGAAPLGLLLAVLGLMALRMR